MRIRIILCAVALLSTAFAKESFSLDQRQIVVQFWNEPGRYKIEPALTKSGVWQARETAEGSKWLWNYNKARGLVKTNPQTVPGAQNEQQKAWEVWINARYALDKWLATKEANHMNAQLLDQPEQEIGVAPADPGPIPDELAKLAGEAPKFVEAVSPQRYTIKFADDETYEFTDQVNVPTRYAYFRFTQGVISGGTPVKSITANQLNELLKQAGISDVEARVMKAVSMLEGGFDSINTYDTGFLSVGFIQFASGQSGSGSLGRVLLREKQDAPLQFEQDFREFGVDVNDDAVLVVVDPVTGNELLGNEAVMRVINDKRLTAVFQRAGRVSDEFKVAQLKVAKAGYYPSEDTVAFTVDGQKVTLKVCDIFKSEAGLATLMDRKVNTGRLDPLASVVKQVVEQAGVSSVDQLAQYEKLMVVKLKFRKDYLADDSLTQPTESPSLRVSGNTVDRSSSGTKRGGRKSGGGKKSGSGVPEPN